MNQAGAGAPSCPLRVQIITTTIIMAMSSLAATPSIACSFQLKKMPADEIRRKAQASFLGASAVVDAEVVTPMEQVWKPGQMPAAHLKVIKVWKGNIEWDFNVVYTSSCDIDLGQKDQKVRILLTGIDIFHADQLLNGASTSDRNIFNEEIDRLIGHRRSASFATFPGEQPVPKTLR